MKKFTKALLLVLAAVMLVAVSACAPSTSRERKEVVIILDLQAYAGEITVSEGVDPYAEGQKFKTLELTTQAGTLYEALEELTAEQKFTYSGTVSSATGVMIDTVDNVKADYYGDPSASYMIYCSSTDYANTEWGTYTLLPEIYGESEAVLGSAIAGISSLPLEDGGVYVILYQVW